MRKTAIFLFFLIFSFHDSLPLSVTGEVVNFINHRGSPWFFPVLCPKLSANAELLLLLCCV